MDEVFYGQSSINIQQALLDIKNRGDNFKTHYERSFEVINTIAITLLNMHLVGVELPRKIRIIPSPNNPLLLQQKCDPYGVGQEDWYTLNAMVGNMFPPYVLITNFLNDSESWLLQVVEQYELMNGQFAQAIERGEATLEKLPVKRRRKD